MGDHFLSTAPAPVRLGCFLTPREEYERGIKVSRQWFDCWQKTQDPRHLSLADACQDIAQQWLDIAQQEHQLSRSTFKRESKKPTPISELELA
jgi:hypothetical protein